MATSKVKNGSIEILGDEKLVDGIVIFGSAKTGFILEANFNAKPSKVFLSKTTYGKQSSKYSLCVYFEPNQGETSQRTLQISLKTGSGEFDTAKSILDSSSYSMLLVKRDERKKKVIVPGTSRRSKKSNPPISTEYDF